MNSKIDLLQIFQIQRGRQGHLTTKGERAQPLTYWADFTYCTLSWQTFRVPGKKLASSYSTIEEEQRGKEGVQFFPLSHPYLNCWCSNQTDILTGGSLKGRAIP